MSAPDKILILDLETNNHEYYGAMASPRHPDNYVVMTGQAIDAPGVLGEIEGKRFANKAAAANWLHIPDDVWLLVAHNAVYELDWMLHQQRPEIMKFLKRGGRVFCTAYAHYLVSNQQDTYPALDVVAPLYGGTPKVDGIKILWEQGVKTADIDPDLLSEYLLGPGGDIENTRKVFYGVVQKLQERGMWKMALDRMEGMLSNAFAMDSGLFVNREVAFKNLAEHEAELQQLQASFNALRKDLPEGAEFKESSDFHMSAWLFGGPLKYRARVPALDDQGNQKYESTECYKFGEQVVPSEGLTEDQFAACVAHYGSVDRYKAGKNKGLPKVHKVKDPSKPQTKWGELLHPMPGVIPLDALPKDVREAFLDEHTGKRKLADESPVYSTGFDALDMLSKRKEFPEGTQNILRDLIKFARLDKDVGTYYLREEKDDEGNVVKRSGMLQYLTPADIVHHNLNTSSTVTTRLSSNKPNFQNLPRGDDNELHTSKVKHMFTSRFGADGAIVEIDYTALEVVTLAAFSQDQALIDALVSGTDMHCLRLSKKLGRPYEEVLAIVADKSHPEHKWMKQQRTDIKPPSFAYQYGATAMGIAFATGITLEEAEQFIANEKALFPGVESFYVDQIFPAVEANITRHREQMDDGTWRLYGVGTWQSPGGTTYAFRQYPKTQWVNRQRVETMQFKPTQMRNYPIQGESGFFVQGTAGRVIRWLISQDFFGGKVHFINQVHDALYLDVHKDVLAQVVPPVKAIMEDLPRYFSQQYGYNLNVPFPVEAEYGVSMGDKVKFKLEDFQ